MCSNSISPCVTTSGLASGTSTTVCSRASVSMPSWMTPIFSNRWATSHMIQCDMPCMRMTSPTVKASAPAVTAPPVHSQMPRPAIDTSSSALSALSVTVSQRDEAHLLVHGVEEALHAVAGIGVLALGMGEHLDRLDVGVAVDDAPGHDRAGVGLLFRDAPQARDEIAADNEVAGEPDQHRDGEAHVGGGETRSARR